MKYFVGFSQYPLTDYTQYHVIVNSLYSGLLYYLFLLHEKNPWMKQGHPLWALSLSLIIFRVFLFILSDLSNTQRR